MELNIGDTCPSCQVGELVERSGKYGKFLGCSMYGMTKCSFIHRPKIKECKDNLEIMADNILRENNSEELII